MQTLVVNRPWREMPQDAKNILPMTSAPHLERKYTLEGRKKSDLTSVSELCYVKMRENILNIYHLMTFN